MSWYVGADIYVKENDNWKSVVENKFYLLFKNLCETRGSFYDELEPAAISKDDKEALKKLLEKHITYEETFVGYIKEDDLKDFKIEKKENKFFIGEEDVCKIYNKTSFKKEDGLVDLYCMRKENRGHGGDFFDINSFLNLKRKFKDELSKYKKAIKKQNEIKNSIEYLKLSEKEKENVNDSFFISKECIEDIKYIIKALNTAISLLDFFEEDDVVIYLFIDG